MKPVLSIIAFLIAIYGSQWAFNHIDAWVGVAIHVGITLFALYLLINFFKKQVNK